jgi:hypothetical protein
LADVVRKESLDGALAVLVLSFCPEEDAPICRALAAALGSVSLPCDNVQVTAGILQHAQAVISTRLHGLILARATGQTAPLPRLIAFALPSAAPKLHAFLSEHGGVCINAPVAPKKQCCANKIDNTHCNFPGSMV